MPGVAMAQPDEYLTNGTDAAEHDDKSFRFGDL